MNITDVGHLTGDNLGDADTGEDRLEKAALREGKTAWDIARFYTDDFLDGLDKLHIKLPHHLTKATDHIAEQIALTQEIEKKGFAYQITDGVYFDTKKYEEAGNSYGELSTLDHIKEGARVEANPEKKDPRDFALWKFSPPDTNRHMEWDSPWGKGFPGWHIECSAMSMKYLGPQFDLHLGGEDLRSTHHPNEIAQAEAATGLKPFVKVWIHGAFLTVDGKRMGKSLGNAYTLDDLLEKGFSPMSLRYFYLTGHYRKQLNFTWEGLGAAQAAVNKLKNHMKDFRDEKERVSLSDEKLKKVDDYRQRFKEALENDLQMPQALVILWEVVKSNIPGTDKYDLIREMDEVLGLDIGNESTITEIPIPDNIMSLIEERHQLRTAGDYQKADEVRVKIETLGYDVLDSPDGTSVKRR